MLNTFSNFLTTRSLVESTVIIPALSAIASGSLSLTGKNQGELLLFLILIISEQKALLYGGSDKQLLPLFCTHSAVIPPNLCFRSGQDSDSKIRNAPLICSMQWGEKNGNNRYMLGLAPPSQQNFQPQDMFSFSWRTSFFYHSCFWNQLSNQLLRRTDVNYFVVFRIMKK